MSSSNPFDDEANNPFFETTQTQSAFNEDDVFGGKDADEPTVSTTGGGGASVPEMAVPSGAKKVNTETTTSNSSILFGGDDADEAKPINFDDEQGHGDNGRDRELREVGFTDKAVDAAAGLLLNSGDDSSAEGTTRPRRKWYNFWKPSFYQPYFDVDTKDVFARCFAGIVPFGKPFFERVQGNPDLYGPFWVTTTVLFLLAISSNFAEYIAYWWEGVEEHWNYDFYKVTVAAAVFYAFLIIVPIVIWALQRFLVRAKLTYNQVACVYGYSLTSFLIATPFCIAPIEWVRWVVILLACVISCACNTVALFRALKHDAAKGIIVIVVAILFQAGLSLTYKLYFFSEVVVPTSFSSSA